MTFNQKLSQIFECDELKGGLSTGKTLEDIFKIHQKKGWNGTLEDLKDQVKMGRKVELEHTKDSEIANKITHDHLAEDPLYYDHLKKMEKDAKK